MRKTHKLLAVAMLFGSATASADATYAPRTLPSGAPACGNVGKKSGESTACRIERIRATDPLAAAREELKYAKLYLDQAKHYEARSVEEYVSTPRRHPNGAPACGNTMGKSEPEPCTIARADQEHQARKAQVAAGRASTERARIQVHDAMHAVAALERTVVARR